jgi:hypothetical protein
VSDQVVSFSQSLFVFPSAMNFQILLIVLVTSLSLCRYGDAIYKAHMAADDENNAYKSFNNVQTLHAVKIFSRESTKTLKVASKLSNNYTLFRRNL